jgi:hypothetical protein
VSGDETAAVLSSDRAVVVLLPGQNTDFQQIQPDLVLGFHELCLVRAAGSDDWYMGSLAADGSITCWASYGNDLYEALRGL